MIFKKKSVVVLLPVYHMVSSPKEALTRSEYLPSNQHVLAGRVGRRQTTLGSQESLRKVQMLCSLGSAPAALFHLRQRGLEKQFMNCISIFAQSTAFPLVSPQRFPSKNNQRLVTPPFSFPSFYQYD